jgi:glutamine synthetase
MANEQVIELISKSKFNKVKFAVADIDGILRGKIIHRDKFLEIANSSVGFCDVVFGWDSSDICYDNVAFTGWHTGYPDMDVSLDLSTMRNIPWENGLPFFMAQLTGADAPAQVCPRTLLARINNQCLQMGFTPMFAAEYEWFNFKETPQSIADKGYTNPQPLTPGMFGYSLLRPSIHADYYNALFDQLEQFNIKLEGMHTETGPGVYEAAIRYDEIMNAADKAILFKTAVKEIAYRHGVMASFMAKWNHDLPGCGAHIHQSLWDIDKKRNLFHDATNTHNMSEIMKSFIAGQLHCLPHVLPMYAPTVNSYKRLVEGAWAPTKATWGIDNRTVAIRAIPSSEKATRIEFRVPGADINPYLTMAAALASGLYGIKHKLQLNDAPIVGNGYEETGHPHLPSNLQLAANAMANSPIAKELFGQSFVEHFTATRLWEWKRFSNQVTDWELKRYFEII